MRSSRIPKLSLSLLALFPVLPGRSQERAAEQAPEPYPLGSTVDASLSVTDLDGRPFVFGDARGKVVVLHFWSMICPYQVVSDPKLVELEKRWEKRADVVFLAVDANCTEIGGLRPKEGQTYDELRGHLKKRELYFPVHLDRGNQLADRFGAATTPHCFVLDRSGKLVYAGALDDDPRGEKGDSTRAYVRDAVEAVLGGTAVAVPETAPYGCSIQRLRK